jgi:predicted ATPase/DNA-binding winged helix-turn-helix (wHTH) protein
MLAEIVRPVYASGDCEIDPARRELRILGSPVPVGGRAFEIIKVLAESAGELVTKDELMGRIWPGAVVGENTLHVHTAAIRKAFGPHRGLLKTVSGRGYRLLGDWSMAKPPVGLQHIRTSGETPGSNFPLTVTRLVGRAAAVQRVQDLVSAYRVVTLTGPGGMGKTSLAVKVGRRILGEFSDGGWLVELAALSDPDLVPSTVASVLGLKIAGEISAESVARAVGGMNLLLVLDNCEHLIDAMATLAEMFVRLCPRTTILTTSREILRIQGEHIYRVPPLEVPAADAKESGHILEHSAVELFIAKAKMLGADFSSHTHHLPAIATICRHLDGIPLAIEFAAARAAVLGIEPVAVGLHDRFALLTSGRRNAVPRHRTLRATLEWSYELLPEPERRLFRRLAVFPVGFTIHAAVAVMGESALDDAAVVEGLANLVTKSLVTLDQSAASTRWRLLETTRTYALEKLAEHEEADAISGRHAMYFRDLFATSAPGTKSRLSNEDMSGHARDIDNVRTALDWSFSLYGDKVAGVHLTAAYAPVWLHLSLIDECRDRCEQALRVSEGDPRLMRLQMELQIALGNTLIVTLGPGKQTQTILAGALEIAKTLNELDAQARVLLALSTAYIYHGDYGTAEATLEQLGQVAREIGDPGIIAVADQRFGTRLLMAGRHREAQRCFERILEIPLPPEKQRPEFWSHLVTRAMARAMLARVLCLQGFAERAHGEARASVDDAPASDHPLSISRVLNFGMCRVATMTGDFVAADRAIAHSIEVATRLNAPFWQMVGRFLEGKLMVERRDFAQGLAVLQEAFDTCRQTGWRVSYPEFRGTLAAAYLGLGQLGEALDAVDDAMANSGPRHGQMWYLPELLRTKGEILLQLAEDQSASAAEDCFDQAGQMAREQGAMFWELRVALSLARLRVAQGRHNDARQILAPVYSRFTEGFGTADMQAARALLGALPVV